MSVLTHGLGSTIVTQGFGLRPEDALEIPVADEEDIIRLRKRLRRGGSMRRQIEQRFTAKVTMRKGSFSMNGFDKVDFSDLNHRPAARVSLKEAISRNANKIDIANDVWEFLTFDVAIDSTVKTQVSYRVVIEQDDDITHAFRGVPTKDGIIVRLPPASTYFKDGLYDARFEVVVEDRILIPLRFTINVSASKATTENTETLKECLRSYDSIKTPRRALIRNSRKTQQLTLLNESLTPIFDNKKAVLLG